MSISFDERGNPKPYELVELTADKFKSCFGEIPDKSLRRSLLDKWNSYITDFRKQISPTLWQQWIGGSFTTNKEKPKDIDLVNLIDPESIENRRQQLKFFIRQEGANIDSLNIYTVDGYCVPVFSKEDPRHQITKDLKEYWKKWLGKDREKNPRGVIRMVHK